MGGIPAADRTPDAAHNPVDNLEAVDNLAAHIPVVAGIPGADHSQGVVEPVVHLGRSAHNRTVVESLPRTPLVS